MLGAFFPLILNIYTTNILEKWEEGEKGEGHSHNIWSRNSDVVLGILWREVITKKLKRLNESLK